MEQCPNKFTVGTIIRILMEVAKLLLGLLF